MELVNAVELARDLIRIDTVNPPGHELDCVLLLEELLQRHHFRTRRHEFAEGRANLVADFNGELDKPGLAFTGHVDTVPLGAAAWTFDPLGAEVVDDRLYGRGSSDMKSGVAAFIAAACKAASDGEIKGRLSLIITAGEETGCLGARELASSCDLRRE